jgi:hypothetical protein
MIRQNDKSGVQNVSGIKVPNIKTELFKINFDKAIRDFFSV